MPTDIVTKDAMWKYECFKCGHKHDYYAGCPLCDPTIFEKPMTDAAEKLADPRMKAIYDKLAAEGGGTWATYMMMDIEQVIADHEGGIAMAAEQHGRQAELAAQQDGDWQPIETAPKDGTTIQVWHRVWKCPLSARYIAGRKSQCKWVEATITTEWPDDAFTHWRQMPAPPRL